MLAPVVNTISPVAATVVVSSRNHRIVPIRRLTTTSTATARVDNPNTLPTAHAMTTPRTAPLT